MMSPYQATVEILKCTCSNSQMQIDQIGGEHLADFTQAIYDKMKELFEDEINPDKTQKISY